MWDSPVRSEGMWVLPKDIQYEGFYIKTKKIYSMKDSKIQRFPGSSTVIGT